MLQIVNSGRNPFRFGGKKVVMQYAGPNQVAQELYRLVDTELCFGANLGGSYPPGFSYKYVNGGWLWCDHISRTATGSTSATPQQMILTAQPPPPTSGVEAKKRKRSVSSSSSSSEENYSRHRHEHHTRERRRSKHRSPPRRRDDAPEPKYHPCVRVFGYCDHGETCKYAKFPWTACVGFLKGRCKGGNKCVELHVDQSGKQVSHEQIPLSEKTHPCMRIFGRCNLGETCKFAKFPYGACLGYLKGKCKGGENCQELHVDQSGRSVGNSQPIIICPS